MSACLFGVYSQQHSDCDDQITDEWLMLLETLHLCMSAVMVICKQNIEMEGEKKVQLSGHCLSVRSFQEPQSESWREK